MQRLVEIDEQSFRRVSDWCESPADPRLIAGTVARESIFKRDFRRENKGVACLPARRGVDNARGVASSKIVVGGRRRRSVTDTHICNALRIERDKFRKGSQSTGI